MFTDAGSRPPVSPVCPSPGAPASRYPAPDRGRRPGRGESGEISDALAGLERYMLAEDFLGYDPYDALRSPVFRWPAIRPGGKFLRRASQQALKRLPVNIRPLLGISKGCNPVTLGLSVQALSYLLRLYPEAEAFYRGEIDRLVARLVGLRSPGYSGACWGYDFDWETRKATIPAFMPTVVATGIITNALYENCRLTGNSQARDLLASAVRFVLGDLNRTTCSGDTFCFSYSPADRETVLNATMYGARLLAQASALAHDDAERRALAAEAGRTVRFVVGCQREDGSWPYGLAPSMNWVDNFHSGYVLDCLDDYIRLTGDTGPEPALRRGFGFYERAFFTAGGGGAPGYYSTRRYPLDATAAAQSILTLTRFGSERLAGEVARWAIGHLRDTRRGCFYYRVHRCGTNRISYMRWSNAWMYLALAYYLERTYALV